jgi:hypothetical protein
MGSRCPAAAKEFFFYSLCPDQLCAHPASCPMGTGVLSQGVKRGRGVTLTTHPYLVPRSIMGRSYTSSPPKRLRGVLWDSFIVYWFYFLGELVFRRLLKLRRRKRPCSNNERAMESGIALLFAKKDIYLFVRHTVRNFIFSKNMLLQLYHLNVGSLYVNFPSSLLTSNFMHI